MAIKTKMLMMVALPDSCVITNVFVFVSAIGEVVVAFWYKKSFTVDRTSSWPGTYCVYQCSAIVYC